jgi:hypothetical protein
VCIHFLMLELHVMCLHIFFQVVGSMNIDAQSLMLTTLAKSLTSPGYEVEVCFLTTPFYPAC